MHKPILILQMQRMGDLILSFPLLGFLQNAYPQNPLWTVAEEAFFSKLMPLAPQTVFFPPSAAEKLRSQSYEAVINLSHREDAAQLAGSVDAAKRFGAYTQNGTTFIGGSWMLYRSSIVQNNRYNHFHWSDLYLLDQLQGKKLPPWNVYPSQTQREHTIGIFVGASEVEKRPSPLFFARLAKILSRQGYRTFFLGGPDDIATAREAEKLSGLKGASLCGKFSIDQLSLVLQKLALLITPDTGPMHLAAWVNTPILNLSVGPVHPWETGPRSAKSPRGGLHHHVVQPALSCAGCWKACEKIHHCQTKLRPDHIALLAHTLLQNAAAPDSSSCNSLEQLELPGLRVYRAGQDAHGLYELTPYTNAQTVPQTRMLLATFWKSWFWSRLEKQHTSENAVLQNFTSLAIQYPNVADHVRKGVGQFGQKLRAQLKKNMLHKQYTISTAFWQEVPQVIQPFSSYTHLFLQNGNFSLSTWENVLHDIEALYNTVS